jgi:hypothetical protein
MSLFSRAIVIISGSALMIFFADDARADAGTAFSESSRAAALGDAVSARPGDAGTMLENPAGLGDLREPMVMLGGHADHLSEWFARAGESQQDMSRFFGGFSFAAATPLPGPEWLRRFRVGVALDLPAQYALRVNVPVRYDTPQSPLYDGREDRMSGVGAIAFHAAKWLNFGAGLALTPSLDTPTQVMYVAGRASTVDKSVEVRLDRSLDMSVAPFLGVRAQPCTLLGLAIAYRAAQFSRAQGSQSTVAGGIVANDPIDFYEFWDPAMLTFGAAVGPASGWSISADLTWNEWSQFKSGFDTDVTPAFHDTVSLKSGVEWSKKFWALRAGYAFEPSPIPEQVADTNYLGASAMTYSLGGGVDLRKLFGAPLMIDGHVRARLGATETAHKDPNQLSDADGDTPGKQIANLGYPGFSSRSTILQAGLSVTIFVGKETKK